MTFPLKDYPTREAQWLAALAHIQSDKRRPLERT